MNRIIELPTNGGFVVVPQISYVRLGGSRDGRTDVYIGTNGGTLHVIIPDKVLETFLVKIKTALISYHSPEPYLP